jgi:hypothetical protein
MIIETKQQRENWFEGRADASNAAEMQGQWKKLSKRKVPSVLWIFASRSSLPNGQERVHPHMATSATRPIFNAADDDWRHSLLNRYVAQAVWALWDGEVVLPLLAKNTKEGSCWSDMQR